jgi:hypothetical protein
MATIQDSYYSTVNHAVLSPKAKKPEGDGSPVRGLKYGSKQMSASITGKTFETVKRLYNGQTFSTIRKRVSASPNKNNYASTKIFNTGGPTNNDLTNIRREIQQEFLRLNSLLPEEDHYILSYSVVEDYLRCVLYLKGDVVVQQ